MKKALSLILVITLIFSCNSGNKKNKLEPISLKDTIFVKPEILKTDKLLSVIWNIKIYDSILILNSPDGKGSVQLLNKHTGKYISTKCIIGRGPGEFSDMIDYKVVDDSIYIYEPTENSLSVYKSDTFFKDSLSQGANKIKFEKHKANYDVIPLNSYYVSRAAMGPRFALFNRNGKYISEYELFPDYYKDVKNFNHKSQLVQGFIFDPKPDLSKFVSIGNIGGILEIFNVEKDSINRILERKILDPNLKIESDNGWLQNEDSKIGFHGLFTTDNYIYTSYSGFTIKEFKEKKLMDYIIVFDWDGNVKRLYKVEGGLRALAADEAEGKIYIVTKDSEGGDAIGVIKM
ncbi:MAG TPA: hypothetical protein DDX10_05660 [Rikenellaceae bacterium]|nr:hypothetical protein [Rikenellaceae bacterium]